MHLKTVCNDCFLLLKTAIISSRNFAPGVRELCRMLLLTFGVSGQGRQRRVN
jgi:hypothetical protein